MTVWSKILILNNINGLQRNYEEWKLLLLQRTGFGDTSLQRNYEEWKLIYLILALSYIIGCSVTTRNGNLRVSTFTSPCKHVAA